MSNTSPLSTVFTTVSTELTNIRAAIVKFVAKLLGLGSVVVSKVETTVVEVEEKVVADVTKVENVVVTDSKVVVTKVEDVFKGNSTVK